MQTCTVEYIRLSDLFEGLPDAKEWFHDSDWHAFTWGDTSHAMIPADKLHYECNEENECDPHEDEKIAAQITAFLDRLLDAKHMMVDLAT